MTDDYTPSLNEVRADYVAIHTRNFDSYATGRSLTSEQEVYASRFDRWLASHDADVVERIAGAIVRCADPAYMLSKPGSDDYSDGYRLGIRDAAQIARSRATPPVTATGEEVDHYPMSAISMRGTSAVCDWCGQVFESSDLYREHQRVMVQARRAREAAATGEVSR